jgi:hypothetical protein
MRTHFQLRIGIAGVWMTLALLLLLDPTLSSGAAVDIQGPRGFVGIGPREEGGYLTVGRVADNSPAKRAGLIGGERILKINGRETKGVPIRESAGWLSGPEGSEVRLTLVGAGAPDATPFEVTLVRAPYPASMMTPGASRATKANWTRPPTKEAGPVEWNGDRIVSRVVPYPDFVSLFIRLPIAHAAALGQGVRIGVLESGEQGGAQVLVENIAPRAQVETLRFPNRNSVEVLAAVSSNHCRLVLIAEPRLWSDLAGLVRQLAALNALAIVPSDLSDDPGVIEQINQAQAAGALTVGRVDRQSLLLKPIEGGEGGLPFNQRIREIQTDIFSTVGVERMDPPVIAAATAAGVAALVLERLPQMTPSDVRQRVILGARSVWQMAARDFREMPFTVDPVTTEFKPRSPKFAFRFRALDAAGAVGVDTEIPWFLNALNCAKAWKLTRGQGVRAVITDQGFHLQHPALVDRIESSKSLGPRTFETKDQNFHGTDMSRIFLAIAPEARIVPVLCSGKDREELVGNIARSFRVAAEMKVDVISGSWAGWFNTDTNLLSAVRSAVEAGVVASWFHYPKAEPGVLRPSFTYAGGWDTEQRLGFLDRFTTDPPGFHPVEIEAGLSATAPQAAGIAALAKSVNPGLTPAQVETLIKQHSTDIGGGILIPDACEIVQAARSVLEKDQSSP